MTLPQHHEEESGGYFSVTLGELLRAHILDVYLPNVLIGISSSVEVPLVTILGRRIGASYSGIADFLTVSSLSRTLSDIPCGIIVEYVGVRNVMFACLALNVVASIIGLFISGTGEMVTFCVLSGTSLGGFFLSRHIFVAGISSKKYRGLLMSFLSGMLRWSHVIGPVASGLTATYLGDVQYSFILSAITSAAALVSLSVATVSKEYQQRCEHSCTASVVTSVAPTPMFSEAEEEEVQDGRRYPTPAPQLGSGGRGNHGTGPAGVPNIRTLRGSFANVATSGNVITGAETSVRVPHIYTHHFNAHPADGHSGAAVEQLPSLHPSLGPGGAHHFHIMALWSTLLDYRSIIWRLGLYITFITALRANRKILITFAGMRASMTDAQISYLLGFSFVFDALLFPLGGLVMDLLGRQFAMVPVALSLGLVFVFLPLCSKESHLYAASAAFGLADALGCGLLMTLTADRAPLRYGAPFFGIMRTLQDLGHVVGARGVAMLMRYVGYEWCCWTLACSGVLIAAWGVFGVPQDSNMPAETPRLEQAVKAEREHHHHSTALPLPNESSEAVALLSTGTSSFSSTPPVAKYGADA